MCGIIGYVGTSIRSQFLIQGLRRLEYRGYDSAGLAVHQSDRFYLKRKIGRVPETIKKAGKIDAAIFREGLQMTAKAPRHALRP